MIVFVVELDIPLDPLLSLLLSSATPVELVVDVLLDTIVDEYTLPSLVIIVTLVAT